MFFWALVFLRPKAVTAVKSDLDQPLRTFQIWAHRVSAPLLPTTTTIPKNSCSISWQPEYMYLTNMGTLQQSPMSVILSAIRVKSCAAINQFKNSSSKCLLKHSRNSSTEASDLQVAWLVHSLRCWSMSWSSIYLKKWMTSLKFSCTTHFFQARKYVALRNFFIK